MPPGHHEPTVRAPPTCNNPSSWPPRQRTGTLVAGPSDDLCRDRLAISFTKPAPEPNNLATDRTRPDVAWFTLEDLDGLIRRHRADDTVAKAITRILRAELIVVDDIGLLPVAADAAEGLYRLVDAAYEKRSVAISSNLHPAGFDELMPKTLATATVARLMHHAHICQTSGESVRLSQALTGQGVTALAR